MKRKLKRGSRETCLIQIRTYLGGEEVVVVVVVSIISRWIRSNNKLMRESVSKNKFCAGTPVQVRIIISQVTLTSQARHCTALLYIVKKEKSRWNIEKWIEYVRFAKDDDRAVN